MTGREQVRECRHWIGAERRHCKEADGVRLFIGGLRWPAHTPNALKGLAEPQPGPGAPRDWAEPPSYRTADARAQRPLAAVPEAT